MALTVQFSPQPFGNVTVANPGTPVQLATNLPTLSPAVTSPAVAGVVTDHIPCNKISIITSTITQDGAGNTGKVYIGQQSMVRSTLVGVVFVLSPGQSVPVTNNVSMNIYQFDQWYVDADNAGDGVYGSFDVV